MFYGPDLIREEAPSYVLILETYIYCTDPHIFVDLTTALRFNRD